ncbi:hypothetical protein G6F60_015497 [Rhizopus arrhizus]|nr:hypothetical protein G6F60_015497 [Rhizopus arrhizus]
MQPGAQPPAFQHGLRRLAGGLPGQLQRQHDVFQRRQVRQQLERLEHEPHMIGPQPRAAVLIQREQVLPGQVYAAHAGNIQPGQQSQ